ncbi:MAG: hypothetical protein J7647_21455 [Cyanobacteria bacterium SBLK]|nr:hypothetical protein [Cyanobacteria bacterium SBLK]
MTKKAKTAQDLKLMAEAVADYESKRQSGHALMILNTIINCIEGLNEEPQVPVRDAFRRWAYAHRGEAKSHQMGEAIKLSDRLFYSGYQWPAGVTLREIISDLHFKEIQDDFCQAILNQNEQISNWARHHLAEAIRKRALACFFIKKHHQEIQGENKEKEIWQEITGDSEEKCKEPLKWITKKEKKYLWEAADTFTESRGNQRYWYHAHFGATLYYLSRYKNTDWEIVQWWLNREAKLSGAINITLLGQACQHFETALEMADDKMLLYAWSNLFLSAIYAIQAKIKSEEGDLEYADRLWNKAFTTFVLALEEDPLIMMPCHDLFMLHLWSIYSRKKAIAQISSQLGEGPQRIDFEKEVLKQYENMDGSLMSACHTYRSASKNQYEDPELYYCKMILDRFSSERLDKNKKDSIKLLPELKKRLKTNKEQWDWSLSSLGNYVQTQGKKYTHVARPYRIIGWNHDYLDFSYKLNQLNKDRTDGEELTTKLGQLTAQAKFIFKYNPDLAIESDLDGTRDLYFELCDKVTFKPSITQQDRVNF